MFHPLVIAALVLPLGFDTFVLSSTLGAAGLAPSARLRTSLILTLFEALMPLAGFLLGDGLGLAIGHYANLIAALALVALGIFTLWSDADEGERLALLERARGPALIGLGFSISLDELAIGVGGGLARLPLPVLAVLIALQAFAAAQIGMRLGSRIRETAREWTERAAGILLVAAGILLLVETQVVP